MYWYVLFVRTGSEYKVEQFLKVVMDTDLYMPFIPLYERIFKFPEKTIKKLKPLFPGYVFIESEVSDCEFIKTINPIVYASCDIANVLKYSNTQFAIRKSEKQMLMSLCNEDYNIESSRGIIEGDQIHIIDGPLKGMESIVKKIDRHKKQAWIELEFISDKRLVGVALEIIEKRK